jgi:hypothetical protein
MEIVCGRREEWEDGADKRKEELGSKKPEGNDKDNSMLGITQLQLLNIDSHPLPLGSASLFTPLSSPSRSHVSASTIARFTSSSAQYT